MTKQFPNPQVGKEFLKSKKAVEVSAYEDDFHVRRVLEIATDEGAEVWIERESKLEEPEYYYWLSQYVGDPA